VATIEGGGRDERMSIGIGDALREARESQGRTVQDAAQSLRVRSDYVTALEEERFDVFGADTYARGHLRNYATWLGLDAAELLGTYDRYVRTDDQTAHHIADAPLSVSPREPLPQWVLVLGAGVAVLAAIALVGVLGNRTPEPADTSIADDTSPEPSPTASPSPTTPTETPTTDPSPSPSPTPTFEGVQVVVAVESDCWMRITVDGQPHPRSETIIPAGETLTIQGNDTVEVRYGDAGGVIVEVNGETLGRAGGNGQVVEVTYTPDGVAGEPQA
jgi:cytoskeleton protein RodZ